MHSTLEGGSKRKRISTNYLSLEQLLLRSHWSKCNTITLSSCEVRRLVRQSFNWAHYHCNTNHTFISEPKWNHGYCVHSWMSLSVSLPVLNLGISLVSRESLKHLKVQPCSLDTTAKDGSLLVGKSTLVLGVPLHLPPSTLTWQGESHQGL